MKLQLSEPAGFETSTLSEKFPGRIREFRVLTDVQSKRDFTGLEIKNGVLVGRPSIAGIAEGGRLHFLRDSVGYARAGDEAVIPARTVSMTRHDESDVDEAFLAGTWCAVADWWAHEVGHWLHETMVKIAAFESSGYQGGYIIPSGDYPYVSEAIVALGIDQERVRQVSPGVTTVETLLLPQPFRVEFDLRDNLGTVAWLRDRLIPLQARLDPPQGRTYVARRSRTFLNEDDVDKAVESHGFKKMYFEDFTFSEKVEIAARSEAMFGPHGSGLGYSMYMPMRSTLIEVFSPNYINPFCFPAARLTRLRYHTIVGNSWTAARVGMDILAPMELLRQVLESWDTRC